MPKKVLFITYYWPPAGGVPVLRNLKFAQYLPQFGWQPVILTTADGEYPIEDQSLLEEVDPDMKIFRTPGFSIHKLYKRFSSSAQKQSVLYGFTDDTSSSFKDRLGRWVKYNIVPDSRIGWYPSAVKKAAEIVDMEKIDVLYSSSPPQTSHLIAQKIATSKNIPWVADFRDPWTDVFWLKDSQKRLKFIHAFDKHLEKKVMQRADAIITVSPSLVKLLQQKTEKKVHLITNGYDEKYFDGKTYRRSDKFRIVYTGSLSRQQSPLPFIKAVKQLLTNKDFARDLQIHFWGNYPQYVYELFEHYDLMNWCQFHSFVPQQEIIDKILQAEMLLLIIPDTRYNEGILTTKIFDYVKSDHPILGIGPLTSDAANLIEKLGNGKFFHYRNIEALVEFIHQQYLDWKKNVQAINTSELDIEKYSRRRMTKRLAELFKLSCPS